MSWREEERGNRTRVPRSGSAGELEELGKKGRSEWGTTVNNPVFDDLGGKDKARSRSATNKRGPESREQMPGGRRGAGQSRGNSLESTPDHNPVLVTAGGGPYLGRSHSHKAKGEHKTRGQQLRSAGGGAIREDIADRAGGANGSYFEPPVSVDQVSRLQGNSSRSLGSVESGYDSTPNKRDRANNSYRRNSIVRLQEGTRKALTAATELKSKTANSGMHINPRSNFFRNWDLIIAFSLFYTASVTPFEVAFLESKINVLFFLNRLIDMMFLMDMFFQFILPIMGPDGQWIYSNKIIAVTYMRGWFPVDVVSTLPYDMISMFSSGESTSNLKILRLLRLMRLAKLLRILRAGRMFQRWEATMSIDYSKVELLKFMVVIAYLAHWLACGWHMMAQLQLDLSEKEVDDFTWVSNYQFIDPSDSVGVRYATSVYWSVATLSTLGYGDVVPATDAERVFATLCAMVGATVFAYMIGNICSIVQGMDEHNARFYSLMDSLNKFMEEKSLPDELRVRLREYFRFQRKNNPTHDWQQLLERMSPLLKEEVAEHVHSKWLSKVKCFHGCSKEFLVWVSMALESETYSPHEDIIPFKSTANAMYIVDKGVVSQSEPLRIVPSGGTVGEDMVFRLGMGTSIRKYRVKTLTNAMVNKLTADSLQFILQNFPLEKKKIRTFVVKMMFRKMMIKYSYVYKTIQKIYPEVTHAEMVEELERCGDLNMVPYMFNHKIVQTAAMDDKERRAYLMSLVWAVIVIQKHARKWINKKRFEMEKKSRKAFKAGWSRMVSLLHTVGLEEYEDVLYNERMTYTMLEDLDETHLRLAGIRLGDAHTIMTFYRMKTAQEHQDSNRGQKPTRTASVAVKQTRRLGGNPRRAGGGRVGAFD